MATKIINILKDDSFEEIFDIFKKASAKEVIFVVPKKSKAFKKEEELSELSEEAENQGKSVSLLCSDPDINKLAKKYKFDVLVSNEGQSGHIRTVNEFELPPSLEAQISDLPGIPLEEPKKEELKSKILKKKPINPEPEIKAAVIRDDDLDEDYHLENTVKVRRVEDIIAPETEDAIELKISPKKEKTEKVKVKKTELSEEDGREALDAIAKAWKGSDSDSESRSSSIWSDWNLKNSQASKHSKSIYSPFNFKFKLSHKTAVSFLAVGTIAMLGLVFYAVGGSAKIFITPRKEALDGLRVKVSVSDKITAVDIASGKIPGQVFTVQKSVNQKFNSTGQKDAVQKARGKITIYNETSSAQPLTATTRFEADSKLVFRTLTSVIVPAAKVSGGNTIPGSIQVEAIADKAGSDYNIASGKLYIAAFREKGDNEKYSKIYAIISGGIHGGINGKATVVSEFDYASALETLTKLLKDQLNQDIKSQTAQFKIIDSSGMSINNPVSTAGPDDAATSFEVTLTGSIKTVGFREEDLLKVIEKSIQKNGDLMVIPEKIEFTYDQIRLNSGTNTMDFTAVVEGNAYANLNSEETRDFLIGKSEKEIIDYLQTNQDVESARVVLSPFWIKHAPSDRDKIILELQY